jgi:transposase
VRQNIAVMEKKLPPKLDREILKQLGTEQLVEIIIDQGKSIEKLTNRVVELEKEIEKLKVSRHLETITSSKPPSGDILKETENKQEEKPEENQTRKRKSGGQPGHRGKRRKVFGGVDRIYLRWWDSKCVYGEVRGNSLANQ